MRKKDDGAPFVLHGEISEVRLVLAQKADARAHYNFTAFLCIAFV